MSPDMFPEAGGPIEPSAAARELAHAVREMYLALLTEGFTVSETVTLIGKMFSAAAQQWGQP